MLSSSRFRDATVTSRCYRIMPAYDHRHKFVSKNVGAQCLKIGGPGAEVARIKAPRGVSCGEGSFPAEEGLCSLPIKLLMSLLLKLCIWLDLGVNT